MHTGVYGLGHMYTQGYIHTCCVCMSLVPMRQEYTRLCCLTLASLPAFAGALRLPSAGTTRFASMDAGTCFFEDTTGLHRGSNPEDENKRSIIQKQLKQIGLLLTGIENIKQKPDFQNVISGHFPTLVN